MGIKKEPVSSAYRFSVVYSGFIVSILWIIAVKNEKYPLGKIREGCKILKAFVSVFGQII